jgi:hypothetical protein
MSRLQYVLADVELRCKCFKKGLALGPLLNLVYFCGFRVVAVVPRLHTLHDDPHQAGSNLEHPRGYSPNIRGAR